MADDYISRKAAMEYLYRALNADPDGNCPSCIHDEHDCQYDQCWTLMDFCEKVEYLGYVPAADVVPVVRCKDCRYIHTGQDIYFCRYWERWGITPNGFCSSGAKLDCEEEPSTVETNLYDEEVIYQNCTVQVWRNSVTGEESWGWWENNHNDYVDGRNDEIG